MPATAPSSPSDVPVLLMSTGAGIGGEESFTTNLAEALSLRGWNVRVAAVGQPHIEELNRRNLRVVELPIGGRRPVAMLRGARALGRYVAREGIRILHAHSAGPAVQAILARRLHLFGGNRPALLWHDHGIARYWWLAKLFNALDLSIANSDFERQKLMAHGLRPGKVIRIHNGIDLGRLDVPADERQRRRDRIRAEFGWDDRTPVAGFIGRLSPEKAPDDFVASLAFARSLAPDVRYLMIGDGIMRPQLEEMCRQAGAEDRIVITGFRRDVPDLLCAIDVLALVSHMETFSLTTLEAMAMHVPCVVTGVGGSPEQITEDENGHVVPDRSPQAIGEALADLLNDPAKRKAFGEAGYGRVRSYLNRDRMVTDIEQAYRSVL